MFLDVPACSGMFHVPGFIDARIQSSQEPIKFDGLLVQPLIEKGMRCRDAAIRKAIKQRILSTGAITESYEIESTIK